jgi:hypothetical protein
VIIGRYHIGIRVRHKKAWKVFLFWMLVLKLFTYVPFFPARLVNATVSGVLPRDMIWAENVYIAGDVLIPKPFKVEVEPGTRVVFLVQDREASGRAKGDGMVSENDTTATDGYERTHASLMGTIIASGATFTSGAGEPGYADWSELVLFNGSVLNDSVVEYSRGGVILLEGNITVVDSISRYALWNCFEDRTGVTVQNSVAHHCWHRCFAVLTNASTAIEGGEFYECYEGLYLAGPLTNAAGIMVHKSCIPLSVEQTEHKEIMLFNKFMKTKPTAEGGVFEGRLIYPSCPESASSSD